MTAGRCRWSLSLQLVQARRRLAWSLLLCEDRVAERWQHSICLALRRLGEKSGFSAARWCRRLCRPTEGSRVGKRGPFCTLNISKCCEEVFIGFQMQVFVQKQTLIRPSVGCVCVFFSFFLLIFVCLETASSAVDSAVTSIRYT